MRVFEESCYLLRLQSPAESEDEKVVGQVSYEVAASKCYVAVGRIDSGHIAFYETHLAIKHCLSQVENNVVRLAIAKCKPDEGGIEEELWAPRHHSDLVLHIEFLSE